MKFYAFLKLCNSKKPCKKSIMLLSKTIPRTLFIFQKNKKYFKKNRYIKSKDQIKVLLICIKQDELQKVLSNKSVLTIRRCSYQLLNFAIFRSYLP